MKVDTQRESFSSQYPFTDDDYNSTSGDNEAKIEAEKIARKLSSTLSPSIERSVENRFSDHQKRLIGGAGGEPKG